MKERDLHPASATDLSIDPNILRATTKLGRGSVKPIWIRLILLIFALLYLISPIDFISDVIPVLGWMDDIVLISATILAMPRIIKR
jgi:uncharacterized membrane protein YkvA (DUF1232 family)